MHETENVGYGNTSLYTITIKETIPTLSYLINYYWVCIIERT